MDVRTVVPADADPHDYEPRPSDAAALTDAALVFRSGGDLDGWLNDLLENAGGDAESATLMDAVKISADGDPHWWHDPRHVMLAVRAIEARLSEADPDGRAVYRRRARRYLRRLRALDAQVAACVKRVPPTKRRIVTTHDALGYFARRYGIDVVGAVIPSLSTQAQASAGVARLVEQIRAEDVEAIFPESSLSAKLEEAIAREADVAIGDPLYADTLGPEGTRAGTYLGATAANAGALVDGMSGGRVACRVRT